MSWFSHTQPKKTKRAKLTTARLPVAPLPRFSFLSGRRHYNATPYLLPNDLQDAHRLDFQHFFLRQLLHGNHWAPIEHPRTILDVACGTGRWAMEIARDFPQAMVVGVDILPPPEDYRAFAATYGTPANYRFIQHDILTQIPFADSSVDVCHMRMVYAAIPANRWRLALDELSRVTKMGGWIELVEGDILYFADEEQAQATHQLMDMIIALSHRRGIDPVRGRYLAAMLGSTGHIGHVHAEKAAITLGARGGHLGMMAQTDIVSVFQGIGTALIREGMLTERELESLLNQMVLECSSGTISWMVHQAIGQKIQEEIITKRSLQNYDK